MKGKEGKQLLDGNKKVMYKIFTPWLRFWHWLMVICVVILFFTGLYIGDPGFMMMTGSETTYKVQSIFSMSAIRKIHFITAVILMAATIFRIYGAIYWRGDRLLPKFWKKKYWEGLGWTVKHYLFIPCEHRNYLRNSLARTAYSTIYIALIIISLTGLAMFAQIRPDSVLATIFNPINNLFGEYTVHLIHHIAAWYFMFFMIVHMYMAFRADYDEKDGEISSMISGYKFFEGQPYDFEDLVKDPDALAKYQEEQKKKKGSHKLEEHTSSKAEISDIATKKNTVAE